jgi:signal transduction histidine kinase
VAAIENVQELKMTQLALERSSQELLAINRYQTKLLEDERSRLSRELHDELGQRLTGLNFFLTQIGRENNLNKLQSAVSEVASIASLVRHLAHQIRPPQLDHLGLVASLQGHFKHLNLAKRITLDFAENLADQRLDPALELTAFRIVQESLTNILRYADATYVSIILNQTESQLSVTIKDDGVGFELQDEQRKRMGLGILGMRERVAACKGFFLIESRINEGTKVTAIFDLISSGMDA